MVPFTPTIPARRRLRLEDRHEFKDSLDSLRESNYRGKTTGTKKWEINHSKNPIPSVIY